ncbi:DUF7427 family protein [Mycolicibacterium llatzerense]|uniref:DUF7427 family protein n=1 Tax=Mycolicibacterium llatzerense TaxID=280871 RepID=UPI0021B4EF27|nr:hypothetical protein [Mycolicibacterium llatzerense]MCT7361248.1 hypothetical protein [Mycolicibacterium llatzerense]
MSTSGWAAIGGLVAVHNVAAAGRGTPMLSETFDGFRTRHPVLAHAVVVLVAGHLLRILPKFADPLGAVMGTLARKIGPLR